MYTISYNRLNNDLLGTCAQSTILTIEKSGIEGLPQIQKVVTLRTNYINFLTAFNKNLSNSYTQEIDAVIESIRRSYTGLKSGIGLLCSSSDATEREKGKLIQARMSQLSINLKKLSNKVIIPTFRSLVKEFRSEIYADAVIAGNLKKWIDEIDESVTLFETLWMKKGDNKIIIKDTATATQLRLPLIASLNEVFNHIQGAAASTDLEEWSNLTKRVYARYLEVLPNRTVSSDNGSDAANSSSSSDEKNPNISANDSATQK